MGETETSDPFNADEPPLAISSLSNLLLERSFGDGYFLA